MIRSMSKKRAVQNKEYAKLKKAFMNRAIFCEAKNCIRPAVDLHHKFGRIGRLLTWVPGFMALCRPHHLMCKSDPIEARALGLLCPVGQWNTMPKDL